MSKRSQNSYTVDSVEKSAPRFLALTKDTSVMEVKRLVLAKMRGIFTEAPQDDETLNRLMEIHVRENCPMVKQGMYTRTRANCEFCGDKHSSKDEYCDLKLNDLEVNESV